MELIFAGSKKTQDDWAELYAEKHPKVLHPLVPVWNYQHNLCTECQTALVFCKHNPYRIGSDLRKEFAKRIAEEVKVVETPEPSLDALSEAIDKVVEIKKPKEPSVGTYSKGRKGRVRTTLEKLTPEQDEEIIVLALKDGISAIELAKRFNVQPPYVYAILKQEKVGYPELRGRIDATVRAQRLQAAWDKYNGKSKKGKK